MPSAPSASRGASAPGRSPSTAAPSTRPLPSAASSSQAGGASTASGASRNSWRSRAYNSDDGPGRELARAVHDDHTHGIRASVGHPTLEAAEMSVLPTPPFATRTVFSRGNGKERLRRVKEIVDPI